MDQKDSQSATFIQTPRIGVIDSLRGFAVFGMLVMNIRVFSGYIYLSQQARQGLLLSKYDVFFNWLHYVFFNGKFYILFSLLFGISFAIQLTRRSTSSPPFLIHFSRRLFVLMLIGIVHLWGIWFSDIITLYSVCGFILLFFRNLPDKKLLLLSFLLLIVSGFHAAYIQLTDGGYTRQLFGWFVQSWKNAGFPLTDSRYSWGSSPDMVWVLHEGNLQEVMRFNLTGPVFRLYLIAADARFIKVLAAFLLGLWAGRNILLNKLHENRPLLSKIALTGWIMGLPLNLLYLFTDMNSVMHPLLLIFLGMLVPLGYILLSAGYAATFLLLYRPLEKVLSAIFEAVGKTALTNYIFQSLICILLFYGMGLGLGRFLGSTALTFTALLIFGLQILLSRLWLEVFRYGPIEWIWRVLTFGRLMNNRR